MNFKVEVTDKFKKNARHLLKKYPSLKQELAVLINLLLTNQKKENLLGTIVIKLG